MGLNEEDRKQLLTDLGLSPDGETLSLLQEPDAPSAPKEQTPVESIEAVETIDAEQLTDEQLLAPDAFERYKLEASKVGRATSSPHNKALYARIQEAKNRLRTAEQEGRRNAKAQRKTEERNHVREKVKADTTERTKQAVLEKLREEGIDLDALAELLKERNDG